MPWLGFMGRTFGGWGDRPPNGGKKRNRIKAKAARKARKRTNGR